MLKSKKEIQREAVEAILSGHLLLEEAMEKYQVKDKRTMQAWVRKIMPLLKESATKPHIPTLFVAGGDVKGGHGQVEDNVELLRENNRLLKMIIELQDKVSKLEQKNVQLTEYYGVLLENRSK